MRYSTGAVKTYAAGGGGGPDLPLTISEAANFRFSYHFAGHSVFSRWGDGNVWGSDFLDAGGGDLEPNGGSDVPQIYFFTGHGSCQNPLTATSPDFIVVWKLRQIELRNYRHRVPLGNGAGNLQFAFIDASCPMGPGVDPELMVPGVPRLHMAPTA